MSTFGFVYIMDNEAMLPDVYKIGRTDRAPAARADELSRSTGVPAPFSVLCYAEFKDSEVWERRLHEWCARYRMNPAREFFQGGLAYAVSILYWSMDRLSFCDASAYRDGPLDSRGRAGSRLCDVLEIQSLHDLQNPWPQSDDDFPGVAAPGLTQEPAVRLVVPEAGNA